MEKDINLIIRAATLDDLPKVQALHLKLFEKECRDYDPRLNLDWTFSPAGARYFELSITQPTDCVFVAVVDEQIVGYLCGGLTKGAVYRDLPVVAEAENFFVLDEFRSKKIGQRLFDKFIEWCRSKNVGQVKVVVSAGNDLALKFYRNNNFKDYALTLEADL